MDSRITFIANTWRCSIASLPGRVFGLKKPVAAITLGATIYIRKKHIGNLVLERHEATHAYQYLDLLDTTGSSWKAHFIFMKIYFTDYFRGLVTYKNHGVAYFNIRFEQEAYDKQTNESYLDNRPKFAWERYSLDRYTNKELPPQMRKSK